MKHSLRMVGTLILAGVWGGSFSQAQVVPNPGKGKPPAVAADWDRAAQGAPQPGGSTSLQGLKVQLRAFQDILNRSIPQSFEQPFTLLQDAKGSYLPNFGAVFHLEVNLHPLRLMWPFDMRPHTAEELQKARELKLQRIRQLKTHLSKLLLEYGVKLSEVPADQNVAIAVHLFNLPSEQSDLPTQLVIEASRGALLDAQARQLTLEEFQKTDKLLFLEF